MPRSLTTPRARRIVSATSVEKGKGVKGEKRPTGGNVASAKEIGKLIAERAKEKGIKKVVFDRGGYLYHGRVKALADAAREAGWNFKNENWLLVTGELQLAGSD